MKPTVKKNIRLILIIVSTTLVISLIAYILIQNSRSINQIMQDEAADINENRPVRIDEITVIDSALVVQDTIFQYNIIISGTLQQLSNLTKNSPAMLERLKDDVKMRPVFEPYLEHGITIVHAYRDTKGNSLFKLVVSPDDYRDLDSEVSFRRAEFYGKKGEYDKAIEFLNKVIANKPKYDRAYSYKASYLELAGRKTEALAAISKALELNPNCAACYRMKGSLEQGAIAMMDFDKAINLDSSDFVNYSTRGQAKFNQNDFRGSINDFNRALTLCKDTSMASLIVSDRGSAYMNIGNLQQARIDLDSAIVLDSSRALNYYSRFLYFIKIKSNVELAIHDYDKSVSLGIDPTLKEQGDQILKLLQNKKN